MLKNGKATSKKLLFSTFFISLIVLIGSIYMVNHETNHNADRYLYKVIPKENWNREKSSQTVKLTEMDTEFIHLAKKEQLERIIDKFFTKDQKIVILEIDTHKLPGKLVYESNPGGTTKYYHLYNGNIPYDAVVHVEERN